MTRYVLLVAAAGAVGFLAGVAAAVATEDRCGPECWCPSCARGSTTLADHTIRDDWGRIRG